MKVNEGSFFLKTRFMNHFRNLPQTFPRRKSAFDKSCSVGGRDGSLNRPQSPRRGDPTKSSFAPKGDSPVPPGHWPGGKSKATLGKSDASQMRSLAFGFGRRVADRYRRVACAT